MQNFLLYSFLLMFTSVLGFLVNYKHIITMLIMLEFMVLSVLLLLCLFMNFLVMDWLILIIIFFLICESVIGISSVVLISRSHGNDEFNGMNLLLC